MNRLHEIVEVIQSLVYPFSEPEKHELLDWHERISILTSLNELLNHTASEYALGVTEPVQDAQMTLEAAKVFLSNFKDYELRTKARLLDVSDYQPLIDYAKVDNATIKDEQVFKIFSGVVSVEKLAISTCSLAITRYKLPIHTLIELVNIIRDECLHLLSLSRLIGVNPMEGGWITAKRQPAWEQMLKCQSALEHVILEHCLFEGEGSFSASYTIYLAEKMNFPASAVSVVKRIASEENRHATLGFYLASLLAHNDHQRHTATVKALELIREIEPIDNSNEIKLHKQTIAEQVLREFARTGNWIQAVRSINDYAEQAEQGIIA